MIAAILIGRKGSSGFPGKNTLPILGRPASLYPMMAARNSLHITNCFLSTDDEELMALGDENNFETIKRPAELCTNEALGEDAYHHAYETILSRYPDADLEQLVLLMANCPTIMASTIDQGIEVLRERPEVDSAVTVSRYNMWSPLRARRENDKGFLDPFAPFSAYGNPETLNCDRDSQGDVWFADMGASIVRPYCLENMAQGLLPQKWMGKIIYPLKQEAGCDLDYAWQLPGVIWWLEQHGFTETTTPYNS